jgi:exodeoxyribonuclease-3
LYLPSGSSGEERQNFKFSVLTRFKTYLDEISKNGRDTIICGDWNIAHKAIDLKNWRGNQKNSGFLPEERAWLDNVFSDDKWFDAFRLVNRDAEQYTWWSNRGQAWAKNVGWRIDYQIISASLQHKVKAVSIYKDERFSDHAPLIIDYEN